MNLLEIVHAPGFQQALVLATALCGGLWLMTIAARVDITASNTPRKALAAYRTDTVDTPLEKLGAALMRRLPGLRNLLGLEGHRRWLLLEGQPWSVAALVGLAVLLAAAGRVLLVMSGLPALALAPVIGFLLPFVRQRSAAEKVRRRVQSNLPDLSAMLAAEMAAGDIQPSVVAAPVRTVYAKALLEGVRVLYVPPDSQARAYSPVRCLRPLPSTTAETQMVPPP